MNRNMLAGFQGGIARTKKILVLLPYTIDPFFDTPHGVKGLCRIDIMQTHPNWNFLTGDKQDTIHKAL